MRAGLRSGRVTGSSDAFMLVRDVGMVKPAKVSDPCSAYNVDGHDSKLA